MLIFKTCLTPAVFFMAECHCCRVLGLCEDFHIQIVISSVPGGGQKGINFEMNCAYLTTHQAVCVCVLHKNRTRIRSNRTSTTFW